MKVKFSVLAVIILFKLVINLDSELAFGIYSLCFIVCLGFFDILAKMEKGGG